MRLLDAIGLAICTGIFLRGIWVYWGACRIHWRERNDALVAEHEAIERLPIGQERHTRRVRWVHDVRQLKEEFDRL